MLRMFRNPGLWMPVLALLSASLASAADPAAAFVRTSGTGFTLDCRPFFVTGVNNHYLPYGSHDEVTRVLDDAVAMAGVAAGVAAGQRTVGVVEQFDIHNDGGAIWNVFKAATARAAQSRETGSTPETIRKAP
jgi:hypothetical protein